MRTMIPVLLVLLASCGAGGAPFKPSVSGTVGVNSNSGVEASGDISASNGTLTIGLGF